MALSSSSSLRFLPLGCPAAGIHLETGQLAHRYLIEISLNVKLHNSQPYQPILGRIPHTIHVHVDLNFLCPPSKKEGHIALHISVGRLVCMMVCMSVSLNLVQLITQERFAQEASNLVGR